MGRKPADATSANRKRLAKQGRRLRMQYGAAAGVIMGGGSTAPNKVKALLID